MLEITVCVCCLGVVALLVRLGRVYRKMDDREVLRRTSFRAMFRGEDVSLDDAVRNAGRNRVIYSVARTVYFLVAVALTAVTVYRIVQDHSWYLSYVKVTSNSIVVDTRLFLGVLMILASWAVFITLYYTTRTVVGREKDALARVSGAGEVRELNSPGEGDG